MAETVERGKLFLITGFLAMEPIGSLVDRARKLGGGMITEDVQSLIYDECITNKICRRFPLNSAYVSNFLKRIILEAESDSIEVLDVLYESYTQYLVHSKENEVSESSGKCYKSFTFVLPTGKHDHLTCKEGKHLKEDKSTTLTVRSSLNMLEGGTGCSIWHPSLFLAEFIMSHPQLFSGKFCFEVGSGVGLLGICLTYVNSSKVILTDGDLSSLANLKHNMEINDITVIEKNEANLQDFARVECWHLPWETATENMFKSFTVDVILGADVVYDPSAVFHLVQVLSLLLRKESGKQRSEKKVLDSKHLLPQNCESPSLCVTHIPENDIDIDILNYSNCPVAYIATVHRNIDTFNYFLEFASDAGLDIMDITQKQKPLSLLPYLSNYDRSSVRLYRIS